MKLLSVGDLNLDIIFYVERLPGEGGEALTEKMEYSPGGSAANLAVAFRRLGGESWFFGAVGRDFIGAWLRSRLKEEGVRSDLVALREDKSTGTMCIISTPRDRTIVGHRGANEALPPPNVLEPLSFDAVFISGYSFLGENMAVAAAIAEMFAAKNVPVYVDVSGVFAEKGWKVLSGLRHKLRALLMNEAEARVFFGGEPFLPGFVDEVVVKLGKHGARAYSSKGAVEAEGFPVPVVDTTGAGDVFDAAYIWASLRGMGLRERLVFANAVAAIKVSRRGGWSAPTLEEVAFFLKQRGVEIPL